MTNKKSFILYTDVYDSLKDLSLEDKGKLFDAMYQYTLTGKTKELSDITKMAFSFIKREIDRNNEKWEIIRDRNEENGKLGGRPKLINNPEEPRKPSGLIDNPENPVTVTVNATVKDIILKDNTQKRDNQIKGDKLVNKVIEEFEEALGFKPTDRKPRFQAYNLIRRLQTIIKENGKEANEEVSLKAINSYFKWLKRQDWFEMVQTLDACRIKTDIFVHDFNLKGDKNDKTN